VFNRIGPNDSISSSGWWDASLGTAYVDVKLTTASDVEATFYRPILNLAILYQFDDLTVYLEKSAGPVYTLILKYQTQWTTTNTATYVVSQSDWLNKWVRVKLKWRCGTVVGDWASVTADGYVQVLLTYEGGSETTVIDQQNKALYVNDGYDRNDSGGGATYRGTSMSNWLRGCWVGFYGLLDTTNITIYSSDTGGLGAGGGGNQHGSRYRNNWDIQDYPYQHY
jgi:hypothetical protein